MKEKDIITKWLAGEEIVIVRYYMTKAETVPYRDKTTQRPMSFDKLTHTVLTKDGAAAVDEDTRGIPNFVAKDYKPPFADGDRVAFSVVEKTSVKGVVTYKGKNLVKVEA